MTLQIIKDPVYKGMAQSLFFFSLTQIPSLNSENLYGGPITLSYDRGFASYSGLPSTQYTDQPESPRTQQVHPFLKDVFLLSR